MPKRVFKKRKGWCGTHPSLRTSEPEGVHEELVEEREMEPSSDQCSSGSSSQTKLSEHLKEYDDLEGGFSYDITDFELIQKELISGFAKCSDCGGNLVMRVCRRIGLASETSLSCEGCSKTKTCFSSKKTEASDGTKCYDVNLRLVLALRAIGKGLAAAKLFCGVMNLPPPHSRQSKHETVIRDAVEEVAKKSMKKAVEEVVSETNSKDIAAAFDGTWQKRGFSSLNGVVAATSVDTAKVIDVRIYSRYCNCPNKLQNLHEDSCIANYEGAAGGMEVAGVRSMFAESVKQYDVRYTKYLGDGDSKGYLAVVKDSPYGPDSTIDKLECVGHVQKRMGNRLRKLKKELGSKKLSDGKPIGGKNRLSDPVIDKIQTFYGNHIRENVDNLEGMRRDIWASYFHLLSTNDHPQHNLCNEGWCKYRQAQSVGDGYDHQEHFHLPSAIMEAIKPIYRSLADPVLLNKCLHGGTQNQNESFNNIIWSRVPKNTFVQKKTLELGVWQAVAYFNDGNISKCRVIEELGLDPGNFTVEALKSLDIQRMNKANALSKELEKKARQSKRRANKKTRRAV